MKRWKFHISIQIIVAKTVMDLRHVISLTIRYIINWWKLIVKQFTQNMFRSLIIFIISESVKDIILLELDGIIMRKFSKDNIHNVSSTINFVLKIYFLFFSAAIGQEVRARKTSLIKNVFHSLFLTIILLIQFSKNKKEGIYWQTQCLWGNKHVWSNRR